MSRDPTAHPLTHTHPARPWTGMSNLGVCKCVINLLWQKESGGGGVETIWWVSIIPKGFPPSGSDDWEPGPQSSCFSPFVLLFWSTKNSLPLLPGCTAGHGKNPEVFHLGQSGWEALGRAWQPGWPCPSWQFPKEPPSLLASSPLLQTAYFMASHLASFLAPPLLCFSCLKFIF